MKSKSRNRSEKVRSFALRGMLALVAAAPSVALASTNPVLCQNALMPTGAQTLQDWEATGTHVPAVQAAVLYRTLLASPKAAEIQAYLPAGPTYAVLADETMTYYRDNLKSVLDRVAAAAAPQMTEILREVLTDKVPAASIGSRIDQMRDGSLEAIRRGLGDMTLAEVDELVYGGDPYQPSAESLVGRYLAETHAATVVRTFPKGALSGPYQNLDQGGQKLVVAVSAQTFETYLKYFKNIHFLIHNHNPMQGTLMLAQNGMTGSYANMAAALRCPSIGSVLPHVVLKTTEAQRAVEYFELGRTDRTALTPWTLTNGTQAYCATGGYSSCTHWSGNIPLGDTLVDQYRFPGAIDAHASNHVSQDHAIDSAPRVAPLVAHRGSELAQRVWSTPGHEQLANVLGLEEQNLKGEFAAPGWVLVTLTSQTSVERVPVVFYVVNDVQAPIAPDFLTQANPI